MSALTRRKPVWKILAVPLAVMALVVASTWLYVRSIAAQRSIRMRQLVEQLHMEALARDGSRPPVHGETLPGNAWTDYSLAFADMGTLPANWSSPPRKAISDFYFKDPKADVAVVRTAIQDHEIAFKQLRQGARRALGNYPCAWGQGMAHPQVGYRISQEIELLGRLAASRARLLAVDGHYREAVLGLLDLFQFARDLCSNSTDRIADESSQVWSIAEIELKELVFTREFPRQDLSLLDEELEQLDRHLPMAAPVLLNDTLCIGFQLLKPDSEREDTLQVGLGKYWRYLYSRRLADAVAFEQIVSSVRRAAAGLDGSMTEFEAAKTAALSEAFRGSHPLILRSWLNLIHLSHRIRYARTFLRLLRIAIHYRSTGEVLDLEDPFGVRMLHSISGTKFKVWSVGPDGVDNGGDNAGRDWSRSPPTAIPGQKAREPRDIVLEVEQ
jgi:hypothetical protein